MKNARCARNGVKSALFWCLSFALIISNLFIVSKLSYVRAEETNTKQEYFDLGFTKENHDFKGSARVNENKTVDLLFDFSHWDVFQEEALLKGVNGDWDSGSPLVSDASKKTYTGQLSFEDAKSLKESGFKIYLPKLGNENGWFPKGYDNNAKMPEKFFQKITETEKALEEKEKEKKEEEAGPKEPEAEPSAPEVGPKEPEAGPTPPAAGSTPPETEKQEDSSSEEPGKTEEAPAVPGTPGAPEKGEPEAKEETPSVPDSGKSEETPSGPEAGKTDEHRPSPEDSKKEESPEAGKSEESPSAPKTDKEEVSPEQPGKEQPGKPAEQPEKKKKKKKKKN